MQIIGLNGVPIAGDEFEVVDSLDVAREKAEARAFSLRNERISAKAGDGKVTLSSLASAVSAGKLSGLDLHQLNVIMKVDVQVKHNILYETACIYLVSALLVHVIIMHPTRVLVGHFPIQDNRNVFYFFLEGSVCSYTNGSYLDCSW